MTQAFEVDNRLYGDTGTKRPFIIASCSGCGGEEAVADPKGAGAVPLHAALKIFSRKGWELGSSRSKDLCPSCVRSRKGRRQAAPLKGVAGPIPADPAVATTAIGARLIEAATALVGKIEKPSTVQSTPAAEVRSLPPVLKGPQTEEQRAASRKGGHARIALLSPEERTALARKAAQAGNARLTPEERSERARKAAQTRRERAERDAEIKRLADEQVAEARREKMGRGIKGFWANMTPEERTARAKASAATLAAKRAAAKAGIPFIRPTPLKPAEIAQAKVQIARAASAANQSKEPVMTAVAAPPAQPKTAEAPRQATREQNLKILEKLHEVYDTSDVGNPHYIKTYTDKQVAEELKFPAAWIAAVRDQFFGPEKNEAAEVFLKDVKELKAKQADLQARFAKHFEELTKMEDDMRRLNDAIINTCRRAGVPVN